MKDNWLPSLPSGSGIYGGKKQSLPRLIYRRLFLDISRSSSSDERKQILESKYNEIIQCSGGDALKMKWILPNFIVNFLEKSELTFLLKALKSKRKLKRNQSSLIFPHCADEFDLSSDFYASAFGDVDVDPINNDAMVTTLGSCFAKNISFHLKNLGYQCENLRLTEDMNSPMSNLELVKLCLMPDEYCDNYLESWNEKFFNLSGIVTRDQIDKALVRDKKGLRQARKRLRDSDNIILTFGNILNFAPIGNTLSGAENPPRFLRLFQSEDIGFSLNFNGAMKSLGYELKAFSYEDTLRACEDLMASISRLNPKAKIILTLSPVPIDSILGMKGSHKSSVTMDCYSKSILRTCIQHLIDTNNHIKYFPAFEIVRWLAPVTGTKVFGEEDAASRHVSEKVLLSIYDYFVSLAAE